MNDPNEEKPVTFRQLVGSTLAAAIGVQKRANRERDFARGKPLQFVVAGLVFTALFVGAVAFVVWLVLSNVS